MSEPKRLTPSELTRMMSGMSPLKATRYYNKCMTNPDTPKENVDLLMQYRAQNQNKFLTEEQMRGNRGYQGSWAFGKGFSGGYRERRGRIYDSDGFSYDNQGNRYDYNGNRVGNGSSDSFTDGGSEPFHGYGDPNGFSDYYGAANQSPSFRRRPRRPFSEPRSYDELAQRMYSLDSDIARTRYFMKVANNPETNPDTLNNLVRLRNNNPTIFASDEEARAAGPVKRSGVSGGGFWASLWKPKDQFDAMSPKKKKFFTVAMRNRNRARNTAYGLRVMTNPVTSQEDKDAMAAVVNENSGLFFKQTTEYPGNNGKSY